MVGLHQWQFEVFHKRDQFKQNLLSVHLSKLVVTVGLSKYQLKFQRSTLVIMVKSTFHDEYADESAGSKLARKSKDSPFMIAGECYGKIRDSQY